MGKRAELCFFAATEDTGLAMSIPPGLALLSLRLLEPRSQASTFFLVDSDCLPVTLFEAFDLWQEANLTRFPLGAEESRKTPHPLLYHQRFKHDCHVRDTREGTSHQKIGQGVILVTEPRIKCWFCWTLCL